MQPGGGLGEALLLGHGQGVGELVQLHIFRAYRSDLHALYVFDVAIAGWPYGRPAACASPAAAR